MAFRRLTDALGALIATAFLFCGTVTFAQSADGVRLKLTTVVLDPGHGGHDVGAPGCDKKSYEKDLVLEIAKSLRERINDEFPEVKVIMTRSTDEFIELGKRADIANKNNAGLFISLHHNANPSQSPNGFSAHILGESTNKKSDVFAVNMNVCKRENAVIQLEEDYSVKYAGYDDSDPSSSIVFQLMQNAYYEQSLLFASYATAHMAKTGLFVDRGISQDNFMVLRMTYMPSVLIECGFVSNPKDLETLKSDAKREVICDALYEAFREFKANYEGSRYVPKEKPATAPAAAPAAKPEAKETEAEAKVEAKAESKQETETEAKAEANPEAGERGYGIQVLVSGKVMDKNDPFFKGQEFIALKAGSVYKYIICVSSSLEETRKQYKELVKTYKDSFIVAIDGDKTKRCN